MRAYGGDNLAEVKYCSPSRKFHPMDKAAASFRAAEEGKSQIKIFTQEGGAVSIGACPAQG